MARHLQTIWSLLISRLFRVRLVNVRCLSQVGEKTISLTHEFICGAGQVQVECQIKWPLLLPAFFPPATMVQLLDDQQRELGRPIRCVLTRNIRTTRVSLIIPSTVLVGQEVVCLRLVRQRTGKTVETISFHLLDIITVARELRVENLDLVAKRSGRRVLCHRIHDEVEQFGYNLKVTLANPEHRSFLNQLGVELQAELVAADRGGRRVGLWPMALQFGGLSFSWRMQLGEVKKLFANGLGDHRFCIRFADAILASKTFPVIALADCLAETRDAVKENSSLWECAVTAVNHRKVVVPLNVVAEDFNQINIGLMLEAPQPEPLFSEVELALGMIVRRAGIEVGRQSRNIVVMAGRHRFEDTFQLNTEMFADGPGDYSIEIMLDDRPLKRLEFTHKTRAQLKEAKAEEILRSLTLSEPRLFALRDGSRVETNHLFETDQAIVLAFCIMGSGFDEDAPVLKWRLGLKLVNVDTGKSVEENRFIMARDGRNRHDDLELPLGIDARKLSPGHYVLQLRKRGEVLMEYKFCILALDEIVPYSRNVIWQNLRAEGQLFIRAGRTRYQCPQVPDTSDCLLPELTIWSEGFNSHLPQVATELHVIIVQSKNIRTEVACVPVNLSPHPLRVHELVIPVGRTRLALASGVCQLVFVVAEKELLALPFELVSEEKVLERVKVAGIAIEAQTKAGGRKTNPDTINVNEYEAISVAVNIEIGIPAPNTTVECSVVLKMDDMDVGHAESSFQLNRARLVVKGRKMNLKSLVSDRSAKPRKLKIIVVIAGEEKGSHTVVVVYFSRMTNFEGQLTTDASRLEVDEEEYQAILNGL